MNEDTLREQKRALREEMIRRRREMPRSVRERADAAITAAVLSHPLFAAAEQVFAYVSLPHEVGTAEIIRACLSSGKTLGLPVCTPETREMTFFRLDSRDELQSGAYRIPVPPQSADRVRKPDGKTLVIVPMFAFDGEGYRLGAGGGYYDRWLAANPVSAIGICYENGRTETLPHGQYDCALRYLITEQKSEDYYGKH